jgi:Domain of unknown function (DUF397)
MDERQHGLQAELRDAAWRKSRRSNPSGNCVELAWLAAGRVAVRNSRHPAGPVLICTHDEIAAFVRGAKDGHFDSLLGTGAADTNRNAICTENSFPRT